MIAVVFPGQGSQKRGMGQALFDEIPQFVRVEREIDALLGYSIRRLCVEDADNRLRETRFTQVAMFVVNHLHYLKALREGVKPQYLAGHSLGEYNALLAAGVFDFLSGIRLVRKRGELMARARNGGMAAVIGLDSAKVAAVLGEHNLSDVEIANFNAQTQVVISGALAGIERAAPIFEAAGAQMYVPLPVSAAFHSRYMADAASEFAQFVQTFPFAPPGIPVMSNVTATPYPADASPDDMRKLLVQQITHPVQWTGSVQYLCGQGVVEFLESGPGNVLTRLVQQIRKSAATA